MGTAISLACPSRPIPPAESTQTEVELEECRLCGARYSYRDDGCSHTQEEENNFLLLVMMGRSVA